MKTQMNIGKWHIQVSDTHLTMGHRETENLRSLATRWIGAFPRSPETLAWRSLGVPSALIRFDYALGPDGSPRVFEVEDRPAGLAIAAIICPGFGGRLRDSLDVVRATIGRPIEMLVTESRRETCDDALLPEVAPGAFDAVRVGEAPSPDAALYVRCVLGEKGLEHFEPLSLSTVSREGDKSYGVALGMWEEMSWSEPIEWGAPFVAKPERGCGSRDVMIYHPDRGGAGFEKRKRIAKAQFAGQVRYVQPYYEPEASPDGDGTMMIRRAIFAWNPATQTYEPIGGAWMSRPCAKVHGASDSVTGALLPPV